MKLLRSGNPFRHAHHAHHVGYEGSHVMLPLVVISVMAIGLYFGVRNIDFSELGKSALFYVVMLSVALGIAGLFWRRRRVGAVQRRRRRRGLLLRRRVDRRRGVLRGDLELTARKSVSGAVRQTICAASSKAKRGLRGNSSTGRRSPD